MPRVPCTAEFRTRTVPIADGNVGVHAYHIPLRRPKPLEVYRRVYVVGVTRPPQPKPADSHRHVRIVGLGLNGKTDALQTLITRDNAADIPGFTVAARALIGAEQFRHIAKLADLFCTDGGPRIRMYRYIQLCTIKKRFKKLRASNGTNSAEMGGPTMGGAV